MWMLTDRKMVEGENTGDVKKEVWLSQGYKESAGSKYQWKT